MQLKTHIFTIVILCLTTLGAGAQSDGRIFLSRDQGESWLRADTGFPQDESVNAMVLSVNHVVLATEKHGIMVSSDGLKSWHPSSHGIGNQKVNALLVYQNILLAGTSANGIFISYNQGNSWEPSSKGLGADLTIRCFLATTSSILVGTDNGIYSSRDLGKTWTMTMHGVQLNTFTEANGKLFAATNLGALRSTDFGKSWDWIWKERAVLNLSAEGTKLITFDVPFGKVYVGVDYGTFWMPSFDLPYTQLIFRITPASTPLLISTWQNEFKSLRTTRAFRYDGLPEKKSFSKILVTPYGILVAVSADGC